MLLAANHSPDSQIGFTLIELMIAISIVGILASVAIANYQTNIRKTQVTIIYQEINRYRMPYQIMINEGAGPTGFSPNVLNLNGKTKNCQYSVLAPNTNATTLDAVKCQIQNLNYLTNQTISLDLAADGTWHCRVSSGIPVAYLP
ncbi:pilin [Psychrobacter submarinus]|uniref:pilin n=1 Tax=Psychrobacter submarinus TaxID=154108 RepID=UPI0027DD2DDB|nr:prepilin-type N-terminal cleavage/methylation domain-containing protein [Psychrobacter submarinus]